MKKLLSAILLLFISYSAYSSQYKDILSEHASNWIDSKKKSSNDIILACESKIAKFKKEISGLEERLAMLARCSSCTAAQSKVESELESLASSVKEASSSLANAKKELAALGSPLSYLNSTSFHNQLKAWESMGYSEAVNQGRSLINTAGISARLMALVSPHIDAPHAEMPKPQGARAWVESIAGQLPDADIAEARALAARLSDAAEGLPKGGLADWSISDALSLPPLGNISNSGIAEAVSKGRSKIDGIKAVSDKISEEGAEYKEYVLRQPFKLRDRLFTESDILMASGGRLSGFSSLLGIKLSGRLSVGMGVSMPQEVLGGQNGLLRGRLLTRLDLVRNLISLDFENVSAPGGLFNVGDFSQRLGSRMLLPIGEKYPLSISLMRTLRNGGSPDAIYQSYMGDWQMGVGMTF